MPQRRFLIALILFILLCGTLVFFVPNVQAQAPTPDSYEENDSLAAASLIPMGSQLGSLSISPAADPDWFRFLVSPPAAYPGAYRVEVVATPGLDLTLNLYDPGATLIQSDNDPSGPNAAVTFNASSESYYAVEVSSSTAAEGWYLLRLVDLTPAPTPTPTLTGTPPPTATSPFPTNTSTQDLGGGPDFAEPNYDFRTAYRIVPGDTLANLNFNPGTPGAIDNDFFVMAVRPGIAYTCRTYDLGPAVDTNLIAYNSANQGDLLGGNDDVDTQSGQINSRLTFTAAKEGDIYLLVGYKYDDPNVRLPGSATYSLTCQAATLPTSAPAPSMGGGGAWPLAATPLSIELLSQPEDSPTPTPAVVIPQTVDVLVGYDRNANDEIEPGRDRRERFGKLRTLADHHAAVFIAFLPRRRRGRWPKAGGGVCRHHAVARCRARGAAVQESSTQRPAGTGRAADVCPIHQRGAAHPHRRHPAQPPILLPCWQRRWPKAGCMPARSPHRCERRLPRFVIQPPGLSVGDVS